MSDKQSNNRRKAPKTAFKKGQSGNPKGRPKKEFCIPDIIRKQGNNLDPVSKKTFYESMVETAWKQAIKGDSTARAWIADRAEGRALDRIEATINKEPIRILEID